MFGRMGDHGSHRPRMPCSAFSAFYCSFVRSADCTFWLRRHSAVLQFIRFRIKLQKGKLQIATAKRTLDSCTHCLWTLWDICNSCFIGRQCLMRKIGGQELCVLGALSTDWGLCYKIGAQNLITVLRACKIKKEDDCSNCGNAWCI